MKVALISKRKKIPDVHPSCLVPLLLLLSSYDIFIYLRGVKRVKNKLKIISFFHLTEVAVALWSCWSHSRENQCCFCQQRLFTIVEKNVVFTSASLRKQQWRFKMLPPTAFLLFVLYFFLSQRYLFFRTLVYWLNSDYLMNSLKLAYFQLILLLFDIKPCSCVQMCQEPVDYRQQVKEHLVSLPVIPG